MPPNFSRHEQFLRIFALLEILSTTRQPLDDQSLIAMLKQLKEARDVFHIAGGDPARYAARPRLLSTLTEAITTCREVEIEERPENGDTTVRYRLQPQKLLIRPPRVQFVGFPTDASADGQPVLVDIERIGKVTPLDVTFVPRPLDPRHISDA